MIDMLVITVGSSCHLSDAISGPDMPRDFVENGQIPCFDARRASTPEDERVDLKMVHTLWKQIAMLCE
jgi:hypothetical protein